MVNECHNSQERYNPESIYTEKTVMPSKVHKANINSIKVETDKLSTDITFLKNDRLHISKIKMHIKYYLDQ